MCCNCLSMLLQHNIVFACHDENWRVYRLNLFKCKLWLFKHHGIQSFLVNKKGICFTFGIFNYCAHL